ncbi:MAG: hypothetical protein JRF33_16135, partial [Deltaproteobacteria bacterium]|nr:hypothetical protein [Deltaproteobacteria bacterium]
QRVWMCLGLVALLSLALGACSRPSTGDEDGGPGDADGQVLTDEDLPDGGDIGADAVDGNVTTDEDGPDTTPPCLLNVFSPGEGIITAHFSEDVDATSANVVGNYRGQPDFGCGERLLCSPAGGRRHPVHRGHGLRHVGAQRHRPGR